MPCRGITAYLSSHSHRQVASVVSNSVWPHSRQPTRLPRLWDSPGKNTGVGCHFLLQCRTVKSESEVAQLCLTLSDPMDCSLPGSSVHGIFQARVLEWGAIAFSHILEQAETTTDFKIGQLSETENQKDKWKGTGPKDSSDNIKPTNIRNWGSR